MRIRIHSPGKRLSILFHQISDYCYLSVAESGPGDRLHQAGANREGLLRGGLQRDRQPDTAGENLNTFV